MSAKRRIVVFVIISILTGIIVMMPFFRFAFYDQMMNALGLSDAQMGILGAVYGTSCVIGYVPSGFLAERFSAKWMLFISAIGAALTSAWYATLPGFGALVVIHVLYAIFTVVTFWSPYLKAIRCLGDEADQGKMFGWSDSIRNVMSALLSLGCLGIMGAVSTATAGFVGSCAMDALCAAVIAVLIFCIVPTGFDMSAAQGSMRKNKRKRALDEATVPAVSVETRPAESLGALVKKLFVKPSIWAFIFLIMAGFALWLTVSSYIGTYCTRVLALSASLSSVISIFRTYGLAFVAGFVGGFILDKLSSRSKGLVCVFLVGGGSALAIIFASALPILCIVLTLILAFMAYIVKATYWSAMSEAGVAPEHTGIATGIISLIGLSPDVYTLPVISAFLEMGEATGNIAWGFELMFAWIIGWCIVGAIAGMVLVHRVRRLRKTSTV